MAKNNLYGEKIRESVKSVLPICLIVSALCLLFVPINTGLFLAFLIGTCLIIFGMGLFNIGSELSMMHIGNLIGAKITQSKNIGVILITSLVLGIAITVAEPDLQVLATNAPNIKTSVLILTVSVGVGIFLVIGMLRILLGVPMRWLLLGFYTLVFGLAAFTDVSFLSVAFDSGGVTTGPMTVPFVMALGVGVSSIRSDSNAGADSFGLVALSSIGPILAVLMLGLLYPSADEAVTAMQINTFEQTVDVGHSYIAAIPVYMQEVGLALLPIVGFFLLFHFFSLKLEKRQFARIIMGLIYVFFGLTLFLTGVNVGFSSLGNILGHTMTDGPLRWILVPLSMLMGWFIIKAEPAVHVLNKQVAELSAGAISEQTMGLTLSIAISLAMGLSMVRVFTGISILWFVLPGYALAILLSFFVPPTFTAIAFDAGGVASGPMTATFMLPLAMGACAAFGGNIVTDAFGLVALVALMPLITVQIMGALSVRFNVEQTVDIGSQFADDDVIELWEVS